LRDGQAARTGEGEREREKSQTHEIPPFLQSCMTAAFPGEVECGVAA
jgi:hypothetical protein